MKTICVEFTSDMLAEAALKRAGFSVGVRQRGAPRGILHGNYLISKWSDLDQQHRDMMHGEMNCPGPAGTPATVTLVPERLPAAAVTALQEQAA